MDKVILFVIFFIIIYVVYFFMFVKNQIKYKKDKIPSDVRILMDFYKIDVKKIGYQKVLRIMNFVNALMLSLLMMVLVLINKNTFIKLAVAMILIVPIMWVTYYFLAKYLKHLEGKSDKNV